MTSWNLKNQILNFHFLENKKSLESEINNIFIVSQVLYVVDTTFKSQAWDTLFCSELCEFLGMVLPIWVILKIRILGEVLLQEFSTF